MRQWHCIVGGQRYGPVGEDELQAWASSGRVRPSDYVWSEGMAEWVQAAAVDSLRSVLQPAPGPASGPPALPPALAPHRGGAVLALGILGITPCFICGIIAWVMANRDLREMAAAQMDPSGRGLTQAGKICGMVGVILTCSIAAVYVLWLLVVLVFFGVVAGAGMSC